MTPYIESHTFRVDMAFDTHESNAEIYSECVRPLVYAAMNKGKKASCFAYGQTGNIEK